MENKIYNARLLPMIKIKRTVQPRGTVKLLHMEFIRLKSMVNELKTNTQCQIMSDTSVSQLLITSLSHDLKHDNWRGGGEMML